MAGVGWATACASAPCSPTTTTTVSRTCNVTSTRGGNVLFRNRGRDKGGKWLGFEDVTKDAKLERWRTRRRRRSSTTTGDGLLDLFVTNTAKWTLNDYNKEGHYYSGLSELFKMAGSPKEYNVLYRNNGDGNVHGT